MSIDKTKRTFLMKKYYELGSFRSVQKAWRTKFMNERAPCVNTIKYTVQRFEKSGSVTSSTPTHAKPSHKKEEAKNQLKDLVSNNPSLSIRKATAITGISYGSVRSILKDDINLKPYKLHEWHELKEGDYQKRVTFDDFFKEHPKKCSLFSHLL